MADTTVFKDWLLKVTKGKAGFQVECRKTIVSAQVLLIIATDGWKWKTETGDTTVRLSMNNPCPMDFDELADFVRVADFARDMLINLSCNQVTIEEVTAMISDYYPEPQYSWPILLGRAETVDGIERFVIYPRVLGAISQMNELFKGISNVEVKQEEIGPIEAASDMIRRN